MSNISVQLAGTQVALPAGATPFTPPQVGAVLVSAIDPTGTVPTQTATLVGTETPPWFVVFNNTALVGTVTAQPLDGAGASIGALITTSYSETAPATFFQPSSPITVLPA